MKRYEFLLLLLAGRLAVQGSGTFDVIDKPEFERIVPAAAELQKLAGDMQFVEGPVWVPDQGGYLVFSDIPANKLIRVFTVEPQGRLSGGRVFCQIDRGVPDGIRCDADGRLYSSAGDGVQIFAPDGRLIGRILVPESPANLCFGGQDSKTLYITARKSLYMIRLSVAGASRPKH